MWVLTKRQVLIAAMLAFPTIILIQWLVISRLDLEPQVSSRCTFAVSCVIIFISGRLAPLLERKIYEDDD